MPGALYGRPMSRTATSSFELSARHAAAAVGLLGVSAIAVETEPWVVLLLDPPGPTDECIVFLSPFASCQAPGWPVWVALVAIVVLALSWWAADVALRRLGVFCDRSVGVVALLATVAVVTWAAVASPGPYVSVWVAVFGVPGG